MKVRNTLFVALAAMQSMAFADTFPSRPIRFVVPFAAGSTSDLTARVVGQRVSTALGQPLIVENVPGAGGTIGTANALRSPADGYTILLGGVSVNAANESLYKKLPYDMKKGFQPISMIGTTPLTLVVGAAYPANNVASLVSQAKNKPGSLSFASGSASSRVAGEMFKAQGEGGKLDIVHIPYKGSAQALVDVMGGQVELALIDLGTTFPLIESGKLKPLAVSTTRRVSSLPNVPTLRESGFPNYDLAGWSAVYAPAGVSNAVSNTLSSAFQKALADPAVVAALQKVGFEATGSSPEALAQFTTKEQEKWAAAIKAAGIEKE
jgi:tripartite-type tricarboxylate transporter receptor subunit TctC